MESVWRGIGRGFWSVGERGSRSCEKGVEGGISSESDLIWVNDKNGSMCSHR